MARTRCCLVKGRTWEGRWSRLPLLQASFKIFRECTRFTERGGNVLLWNAFCLNIAAEALSTLDERGRNEAKNHPESLADDSPLVCSICSLLPALTVITASPRQPLRGSPDLPPTYGYRRLPAVFVIYLTPRLRQLSSCAQSIAPRILDYASELASPTCKGAWVVPSVTKVGSPSIPTRECLPMREPENTPLQMLYTRRYLHKFSSVTAMQWEHKFT